MGLPPTDAAEPLAVSSAIEKMFDSMGLPRRLEGVAQSAYESILSDTLYNFNADRTRELGMHRKRLAAMLSEAA